MAKRRAPRDKHSAPRLVRATGGGAVTLALPQATQVAVAAYERGHWTEAERLCRLILRVTPYHFDTLHLLGVIATNTRRGQEAVELLSRALSVKPNSAEAHCNRGNALLGLRRPEEALQSYDRALAIKPYLAEALLNRGTALSDLKRREEALASYERVLAIKPDYVAALNNRGSVLRELKRFEEALASYERALAIKPDHAAAHYGMSLCRLQLGDFARGWQGYEWRWHGYEWGWRVEQRDFPQPRWLGGEPLEGKTILLYSEQGLGDTLQFCRYATLVAARGGKVVLEVQPPLLPLLASLEGTIQVIAKGAEVPAIDYQCPLLSLPLAFNTRLHTIPSGIPYVHSDAARVGTWQERLGRKTKPRIGVVWSGNPTHHNDHNRTLKLAQMIPLVFDWAQVVSLQNEVRNTDTELLASRTDILHFGDELEDFADTAALVDLMDVVVTVDTSAAHLAGAMGKAVWILLPFSPDWRWLLDREDSLWYPTARLFRQPAIDDWTSVINLVREELVRQFGARR